MSTNKESAFPLTVNPGDQYNLGMSLHDWFAGQALAGILANSENQFKHISDVAKAGYRQADVMMEARAKQQEVSN